MIKIFTIKEYKYSFLYKENYAKMDMSFREVSMRVITGSAKGRHLITTKGNRIRPTSERIKEALFSILGNKVVDSVFVDCFAGTGAIGIEALSRGAKKCYFIDNHPESLELIKKNLQITDLLNRSKIISKNIVSGIREISSYCQKIDIIFLDPPYLKGFIQPTLLEIININILHPSSLIIVEHSKKDFLKDQEGLYCLQQRIYGNTVLSFFMKEEN